MKFERTSSAYKGVALILLNTIILILLFNFLLFFSIFLLKDKFAVGPLTYNETILKELYPNNSLEETKSLLKETYQNHINLEKINQGYDYEPFTGFKEKPRDGKYVNIDKNGFRKIENQCNFPTNNKNYNIFIFGGSTTFGLGLPDSETIPSRIQERLKHETNRTDICVYNFGRTFYYSSQERILFESLLLSNQKPDMIVFIDGLNEPFAEPQNAQKLRDFMIGKNKIGL